MTISKCGRVPKTIKTAVQEQFTHMGDDGNTTPALWNNSTFKYISAPCGAGKTTSLCKLIKSILNIKESTERFIIIQNTLALAKKTADKLEESKLIISDLPNGKSKVKRNVINSVLDFLKNPIERVLIISDKTFFKIPVELLHGWQIWFDDVTNFHSFKNINDVNCRVKELIYHELMQDHEIVDEGTEKYLTAKKKTVQGDLLFKVAQELSVISENDILIMNNDYFNDSDKSQLSIIGWKDLKKYIGLPVTFMGANFEKSLIYKANHYLFEKIEFDDLRQRKIPLNQRLKVYYFSENTKLSKTWKESNPDKLQCVYDYLDKVLKGQKFYWTNNNQDKQKLHSGTKISPDVRGLNDYIELKTCVWLACMRPSEIETKLCELLLGITGEDIHHAREYENLHQFALRGISRNFGSTETQIVYVFDKSQAEYLSTYIEHIPEVLVNTELGKSGRPKGAKNVNNPTPLSDTKGKRYRRWKGDNPELALASFKEFLSSDTNRDLSTEDIAAIWNKYEREVQKISNPVRNTDIKGNMSENNPY